MQNEDKRILSQANFIIKPEGFEIPKASSDVHGITTERAWAYYEDGTFEYPYSTSKTTYRIGDRIGQIIIMPYSQIEFEEVEELSETERGTKGYGSSGA